MTSPAVSLAFTPLTGAPIDHIPTMLGPTWFDVVSATTCQSRTSPPRRTAHRRSPPPSTASSPPRTAASPCKATPRPILVARTDTSLSPLLDQRHQGRAELRPGDLQRHPRLPDPDEARRRLGRQRRPRWIRVPRITSRALLVDSHPNRQRLPVRRLHPVSPDGSLTLATYTYSSTAAPTITIVRSMGTGTRPRHSRRSHRSRAPDAILSAQPAWTPSIARRLCRRSAPTRSTATSVLRS